MEAMEIVKEEALISVSPLEIYSGSDMNESDISICKFPISAEADTNESNASSLKRKCDSWYESESESESESEEEESESESEVEKKPFVLILDCLDRSNKIFTSKLPAAIAAPCVVSVVSRHIPVDMVHLRSPLGRQQWGSGIIIECQEDVATRTFLTTIITVASLFNNVDPSQIQVPPKLSSFLFLSS